MAIITSDDAEDQSSSIPSIEPIAHQEASNLNKVDSEILEENSPQKEFLVGEDLHMLLRYRF